LRKNILKHDLMGGDRQITDYFRYDTETAAIF
jgi:hypothetical protein